MLDPRSPGYLAAPSFQAFYQEILDRYMRPIARLLFPEVMRYDSQTFGFSINYQPTTDTSIRPHSDASAVTLNFNLNLPGERFTGSTVDFLDRTTNEVHSLSFAPGIAVIHRGSVPHAAQPITSGERTNFVLWLYGNNGQVPFGIPQSKTADPGERWTTPTTTSPRSNQGRTQPSGTEKGERRSVAELDAPLFRDDAIWYWALEKHESLLHTRNPVAGLVVDGRQLPSVRASDLQHVSETPRGVEGTNIDHGVLPPLGHGHRLRQQLQISIAAGQILDKRSVRDVI